ncbi:TetR/AcrR family transcriptional regulator [Nocardia fluminea]|uniref:TetR/AcrR family transcriptional regulator n=1 Tax=Nocardia fluminea TaxID=134984 RepID=UPI003648F162
MGRLSRAEQQEVTRQRVLDAARREFTERGFRGATVDGIAEHAQLTRGAVYSNFPGKRALYFAVLAREAEHAPPPEKRAPGTTGPDALGIFASTWAQRLPRSDRDTFSATEQLSSPVLSIDLIPEIQSEDRISRPFAQLIKLDAVLLGLALESLSAGPDDPTSRFIHTAEAVLTVLYGATQLSFAAPGFVDPDQVVSLCQQLAHFEVDKYSPPIPRTTEVNLYRDGTEWEPPSCTDLIRGLRVRLDGSRLIMVLGIHKISAIREVVTACPRPIQITIVLVTCDQTGELAPLARLALADFSRSLRYAFPEPSLPNVQVVVDDRGSTARACGIETVADDTEAAIMIDNGRITWRASGAGACHAMTTVQPAT